MISFNEAASKYGCSKHTVRTRIIRAGIEPVGTRKCYKNTENLYDEKDLDSAMSKPIHVYTKRVNQVVHDSLKSRKVNDFNSLVVCFLRGVK